jgi:hypothetical protein
MALLTSIFPLLFSLVCLVYALIDLLAPQVAIRWQVAATARRPRTSFGRPMQRWLGIDPNAEPWNDPKVQRKVRLIGVVLTLVGLVLTGFSIALLAAE